MAHGSPSHRVPPPSLGPGSLSWDGGNLPVSGWVCNWHAHVVVNISVSCCVPAPEDNSQYQESTSLGEFQPAFLESGIGYSESGSGDRALRTRAALQSQRTARAEPPPWSFLSNRCHFHLSIASRFPSSTRTLAPNSRANLKLGIAILPLGKQRQKGARLKTFDQSESGQGPGPNIAFLCQGPLPR